MRSEAEASCKSADAIGRENERRAVIGGLPANQAPTLSTDTRSTLARCDCDVESCPVANNVKQDDLTIGALHRPFELADAGHRFMIDLLHDIALADSCGRCSTVRSQLRDDDASTLLPEMQLLPNRRSKWLHLKAL